MLQLLSKIFTIISLLVISLCLAMIFFPSTIKNFNEQLKDMSNVLTYLSTLFAAAAILIASLAYQVSLSKPKLKLIITPRRGTPNNVVLNRNPETGCIENTIPLTSWHLELVNEGNATAKFPYVEIAFFTTGSVGDNAGGFNGWESAGFVWGGGYYICRWAPGESVVIYPGSGVDLPEMDFSNKYVTDPLEIEVTLVADQLKKKSYRIPVRFV